jgi:Ras-related protein Rab-18
VYDVTSRASFDALPGWFSELETFSTSPDVVKCIVGNKVDKEFSRVVSKEEGKTFADSKDAIFIEASAKKGVGVQGAFDDLVNQVSTVISLARDPALPAAMLTLLLATCESVLDHLYSFAMVVAS